MNQQSRNIKKTVLTIVAIMVTILVLFVNKITTPRYLSDIELKVNGLELISSSRRGGVGEGVSGEQWMLLVNDPEGKRVLDKLHSSLKSSIRDKVLVVYTPTDAFVNAVKGQKKLLPIVKPSGEFIGYFKPPYDKDKMVVTLSSVVTHR